MAVKNQLATKPNNGEIVYESNGSQVKLSPKMVRDYLVSGNGAVTDQEVVMFLSLCRYQGLNPFLREAYLIKFGGNPATIIVGKDVLLKRAMRNPNFKGLQAGVVVLTESGEVSEREGAFVLENETLVGGWAKVFLKDHEVPFYASISMKEYSTGKSNWASKPATMIRKVALAQALREAFPEETAALYEAEELNVDTKELNSAPVEIPSESPVEPVVEAKVIEPVPTAETPVEGKQGGQESIDNIMFPPILDNQPPFEL